MGFMIGIAIYLIVLIIAGSGLSSDSLAFPELIMVAAGIIMGLKLLIYKSPRLGFLDPGSDIGSLVRGETGQTPQEQGARSMPASRYEPVAFVTWLVTFPSGVYLFGFIVTMAIWLFGFLFLISRLKLFKAVLICACTLAGIYVVFVRGLGVHFPQGILF
jgi:hypothetical protein